MKNITVTRRAPCTNIPVMMMMMMMMIAHLFDIVHFPEILPVITKQAVTKMPLHGRKQPRVRNSAHGNIIPVRKGNATKKLSYTIPYHLQPNNTRNIPMVLCVCTLEEQEREKMKKKTRKLKGNKTKKKKAKIKYILVEKRSKHVFRAQAESRGQGSAVCWYDQSYDLSN